LKPLLILTVLINLNPCFAKTLNLGMVFDKSEVDSNEIINSIKSGLEVVLDDPKSVVISKENIFYGNGDITQVKENFQKIMLLKSLDMVITIGPISSILAAKAEKLNKPVITTHLFDRSLAKKKNLAALKLYPNLAEVRAHFKEINVGKNILVVSQEKEALKGYLEQVSLSLSEDYSVSFYKTNGPIDSEKLNGIDFVFYIPEPFENSADFASFQKTVNGRKILSYSISGTEDFKNGVLLAPEITNLNQRLGRVMALSIMEFKQGKSVENLEQKFLTFNKVTENQEVAKEFGIKLGNLSFMAIGDRKAFKDSNLQSLSLKDAVSKASDQNFSYQTSKFAFEQSEYNAKSAYTKFFPQIDFEGSGDLYKDPEGYLLTRTTEPINRLNFAFRQFVFSDNTLANYKVSTLVRDQTQYKSEGVKLDVVASTVIKYLETLNLASIVKIREDNLALTMENLQIAELNFKTGKSAKFEVYRWESQVAQYKKTLADANFEFRRSLHELNRLMNNDDLTKEYSLENYEALKNLLVDEDVHLPSKYSDLQTLDKYISFVIDESKEAYPLLKQVDQDVKIAERLLLNKDRAFYLPKVELFSDYTLLAGDNPFAANDVPPNDFRVGLRLTFPLFESLNKFQERSAEVKRLSYSQAAKSDVYQQVEKLIRDQVVGVRTAFAQIKYETERETAAKSNLDLIRLSYKTGKIDILFLLDAQNFYFTAREGVIIAKNNFLLELTRLEMRMGSFSFLRTPTELNAFHERYRKFMSNPSS
jgi:outer membrane protein